MHERAEMAIGGATLLRRHRGYIFFGRFRPILSDRCLSCLSVTLVYCGQRVGWIKIPLGTEVGLGAGHSVLDGDPALPPRKAHSTPTRVARWCNG